MKGNAKWLIGSAVVALLVVVVSWFTLVSPKRSEAADVKGQVAQARTRNDQLRADLATLNSQKDQLTAKQAEIAAVGRQVPDDPQVAGLIRTLRRTADDDGVVLSAITPGAAAEAKPLFSQSAAYAAISLDMTVLGTYDKLALFLQSVEQQQRVVVATSVSLSPNDLGTPAAGSLAKPITMTVHATTYSTDTSSITPPVLPQLEQSSAAGASTSPSTSPSTSAAPAS